MLNKKYLFMCLLLIVSLYISTNNANATVAGGSSPQLQWNNAGTLDGVPNSSANASGNVGIGTALPLTPLTVYGTSTQTVGNFVNLNSSGIAGVTVQGLANGSSSSGVTIQGHNQSTSGSYIGQTKANNAFVVMFGSTTPSHATGLGNVSPNDLAIGTDNLERMRIAAGGNIGVGSTVPGQALDVNGGIRTSLGSASKGACFKADKTIGYCSTALDASGSCTCN